MPCAPQVLRRHSSRLGFGRAWQYAAAIAAPVLNRVEVGQRLAECEEEIRALGVNRLALFGSVLRGQTHARSDVDIVVEFAPASKTYDRFLVLSDLLERRLSRRGSS